MKKPFIIRGSMSPGRTANVLEQPDDITFWSYDERERDMLRKILVQFHIDFVNRDDPLITAVTGGRWLAQNVRLGHEQTKEVLFRDHEQDVYLTIMGDSLTKYLKIWLSGSGWVYGIIMAYLKALQPE